MCVMGDEVHASGNLTHVRKRREGMDVSTIDNENN